MAALQGKAEVVISPDPSNETVGRLLRDADALILRTATKVTRAMIAASPRLKVISRTGGGLNNVDIDAATEYVEAWKAGQLVRSGPTAGTGQKVKASAAKRTAAGKGAAKKAAKKAARKAVKQAVKQAAKAERSARKGAK